jgi:lytic murein transglycosylase
MQSTARLLRPLLRLVIFVLLAAPMTATAQPDPAALNRAFGLWVADEIWPEARRAGISRAVFDAAFNGVVLNLTLPDLVIPGADAVPANDQAEFRSPGAYFGETGLASLTRTGRQELQQWSSTLTAIEARYGVPGEILLAVWARESAFGHASIPEYAIEALATEAYLGRRAEKFRGELIAALQILEAGDVSIGAMRSSWAGGLGLPQFLPSTFLAYAIDFDGDGHRDIWGSVPDALASIANYLAANGWNPSLGWGEEAAIPDSVSCTLEGPLQGLPLTAWQLLGIAVEGDPGEQRYLLMPAGRFGPTFIVTDNFYVLKTYNESDVYALYVGHLADRIGGRNEPFTGAWLPIDSLTRGDVQRMQLYLEAAGHDVGGADGLIGFRTRIAVGAMQSALGQPETCFPDRRFIQSLGQESPACACEDPPARRRITPYTDW